MDTLPWVSWMTIGRVVHYIEEEKDDSVRVHRAAVVTLVHSNECVDLAVFYPTGLVFHALVVHASTGTKPGYDPGTWHFPDEEPGKL